MYQLEFSKYLSSTNYGPLCKDLKETEMDKMGDKTNMWTLFKRKDKIGEKQETKMWKRRVEGG